MANSDRQDVQWVLTRKGLLSASALDRVRRLESETGDRVDRIATKLGLITDRDLAQAYADLLETPVVTPSEYPLDPVASDRIAKAFLRRARAVPLVETDSSVVLAMADPLDDAAVRAIEFTLSKSVIRRAALPSDIDAAQERLYADGKSSVGQLYADVEERGDDGLDGDLERLKDQASGAPVIRLVNTLLTRAVEQHASDIHLESADSVLRVRYRIDGVLQDVESPPARLKGPIISRIKIMARLNVAERRLPQDGRLRLAVRGKEVDFRVSTVPGIHGECVVLRILDREVLSLDFATLGFDSDLLSPFLEILNRPHGIVLVTGPTGSGKTTTLYTALSVLNSRDRKLLTAEDPIEYMLDGVNQVQVKPEIGLTFASALRSFLRQDPDVLMIGEIRDLETARIAVQAALTGHLVLSTVHTNDAASAMTRLLDVGVEDYLLTSTINGVLAQRLVRRLCEECRESYTPTAEMIRQLGLASSVPAALYRAKGCPACAGTGFKGRTMILEFMAMNDEIRTLVMRRSDTREIAAQAVRSGMTTLFAHGLRKVQAGLTTIEEILRVTRDL